MMRNHTIGLLVLTLFGTGLALDVKEKSVEGTEAEADGLSQKQLAMVRYFAYLTFMTEGDKNPWKPWYNNGHIPEAPFGNLRYQVSDVAYAVAMIAQRTPAYTEVFNKILRSASNRMIMNQVWDYITGLYPANSTNHGSDPLRFKNIMYSGHLLKTMALHQVISGDMTYSDSTWDFVHGKSKTTYNLSRAMQVTHDQMMPPGEDAPEWAKWYKGGGVPCEPVMIFLLCNNFPHNAFHAHDGIHGTNFKDADKRWQDEIRSKVVPKASEYQATSPTHGSYFKIGFLMAARSWIPDFPIEGGDSWTLAFIRGWWDETDPADKELIYKGYAHLANNVGWKIDKKSNGTHHSGEPNTFDYITTSFFPMIERQFWTPSSGLERKSAGIMKWFEQYGELIDTDGDGIKESYRYHDISGYTWAANANLLAAMAFPNDGSSNDVLRDLLTANPPFYKKHANEPRIEHADYPSVMVTVARFDASSKVLRFQLVEGDKAPAGATVVELGNCQGLKSVSLGGKPFTDFKAGKTAGSILLSAPQVSNTPQIWEVAFSTEEVLHV